MGELAEPEIKPLSDATGPLKLVRAIEGSFRVVAHPRIVSTTSARPVDTGKNILDAHPFYA